MEAFESQIETAAVSTNVSAATAELWVYVDRILRMPIIGGKMRKMLLDYDDRFKNSETPLNQEDIAQIGLFAMDVLEDRQSSVKLAEKQAHFAEEIERATKGVFRRTVKAGIGALRSFKKGRRLSAPSECDIRTRFERLLIRHNLNQPGDQERVIAELWAKTIREIG